MDFFFFFYQSSVQVGLVPTGEQCPLPLDRNSRPQQGSQPAMIAEGFSTWLPVESHFLMRSIIFFFASRASSQFTGDSLCGEVLSESPSAAKAPFS